MTLIEVMTSLALLAISILGVVGGLSVAINGNSLSARHTLASQFAQARVEYLVSQTRAKIPTAATVVPVNCAAMAVAGVFDPTAAPGTGGWMLDVIDGTPPAGGGDDAMFGPVLFDDSSDNSSDNTIAKTKALRQTIATNFITGADVTGCATPAVANDAGVLCREVHIEPFTLNGAPMLRAYVRVIQGGGDWRRNYVLYQQDIAQ
jgi:hypothetical protein